MILNWADMLWENLLLHLFYSSKNRVNEHANQYTGTIPRKWRAKIFEHFFCNNFMSPHANVDW